MKYLLIAAAALSFSVQAEPETNPVFGRYKLENILSCKTSAEPAEVVALIKLLGGVGIVQTAPFSDAEYTVPNPVEVFGRPVTKISIHQGANIDGQFNEYGSLFSGETFDAVARIAGVNQDAAGQYRKQVGDNDLILRPEAGSTYVTCANDVRTVMKTYQRTARGVAANQCKQGITCPAQ